MGRRIARKTLPESARPADGVLKSTTLKVIALVLGVYYADSRRGGRRQ